MKILIQHTHTKQYLSAFSQWVNAIEDAKNFWSILPAYNYATNFTSEPFEVVLYSQEDGEITAVMDGVGKLERPVEDPSIPIDTTAVLMSVETSFSPSWERPAADRWTLEVLDLVAA